jgi:hypothetical protein
LHLWSGIFGFSALLDAARRLSSLSDGRRRRGSVGRRQTHFDPGVYVVRKRQGKPIYELSRSDAEVEG